MRIVFMGSGDFAVASLQELNDRGFEIALVVSQPDRPAGRGRAFKPTAVKERALFLGYPVATPEKIGEAGIHDRMASTAPRAIVVAAYGQKIPRSLLGVASLESVNVHGSLLPRHRGASPVVGSLLAGDRTTGVTIQLVADKIDAGDIVLQEEVAIEMNDNAETLEQKLANAGAKLLPRALEGLDNGSIVPVSQDHSSATLTRKINKRQGQIPWEQTADEVVNHIRAFTPWPGAYSILSQGPDVARPGGSGKEERLTIVVATAVSASAGSIAEPGQIVEVDRDGFVVRCGKGAVSILKLQRSGKKAMDAGAFLRGFSLDPSASFVDGGSHK